MSDRTHSPSSSDAHVVLIAGDLTGSARAAAFAYARNGNHIVLAGGNDRAGLTLTKDSAPSSRGNVAMKSYPERIALVLAKAPPAPPLKRKHEAAHAAISDDTKAKLILLHAAYATYGRPLGSPTYMP